MLCKRSTDSASPLSSAPSSRDPLVRTLDRIDKNDEIMSWVDGIIMATLDLPAQPSNVDTHGVVILIRAEPLPSSPNASNAFHIVSATWYRNADMPSDFGGIEERSKRGGPMMILRACWQFEHLPMVFCDYTRAIKRSKVRDVFGWADGERVEMVSVGVEAMIEQFNRMKFERADIMEKFTLVGFHALNFA